MSSYFRHSLVKISNDVIGYFRNFVCMYVFLRTTTTNPTPTSRRPVSACKPVRLWGLRPESFFQQPDRIKGVFKICFVKTVLQFAKSWKQNILALLKNDILNKPTYVMDVTLDKELSLFNLSHFLLLSITSLCLLLHFPHIAEQKRLSELLSSSWSCNFYDNSNNYSTSSSSSSSSLSLSSKIFPFSLCLLKEEKHSS